MLQTVYYDPLRAFAGNRRVRQTEASAAKQQVPAVDIIESKTQYQLLLDLPGIEASAIDVTEERKVLTVRAEKKALELGDDESRTRTERQAGVYQRQFTLPDDADTDTISAESKDGVLKLVIKRKQPEQTLRKIKVAD